MRGQLNIVVAIGMTVATIRSANAQVASDTGCGKELPVLVRDDLAERYHCASPGVRCIDGHTGQAFARSTPAPIDSPSSVPTKPDVGERRKGIPYGYFNSRVFYQRAQAGAQIQVNVFARTACATERLAHIEVSTAAVKSHDSKVEGVPATTSSSTTAPTPPAGTSDVAASLTDATEIVDKSSSTTPAPATPPPAVAKAIDTLEANVDKLPSGQASLRTKLKARISTAKQLNTITGVKEQLALAKTDLAQASGWLSIAAANTDVSVVTKEITLPDADENSWVIITVTDAVTTTEGDAKTTRQIWPDNKLSVEIDHGYYFWEAGVLVAAVYHGTRYQNGSKTACPDACKTSTQTMLAASVFFGRPKFKSYARRNWIPGVQIGLNSDLTKFADEVSLGLVLEPITGIALTGGVVLHTRASSTLRNADDTLPTERVALPVVGITVTTDFMTTVKSAGAALSSGDDKN